jgi:hypothetical protein
MYLNEEIQNKWSPVLGHPDLPAIKDAHRRSVTAMMLENTENALRESSAMGGSQFLMEGPEPTNSIKGGADVGAIDTFDPVLISLVRRAMPNLVAYDICGVQPMTGPTGLIFAMRARYANNAGDEALYNEANTRFSTFKSNTDAVIGNKHQGNLPGNTTHTINIASQDVYNFAGGMETVTGEGLGGNTTLTFPEMAFSIEKVTVTANTRALKAEYSMELAQDLKAIHGLDAETELSNILSAEILAEINREIVRTINVSAVRGATEGTTAAGIFDLDTDSNGRWSVEKFKGLMFQIEREANQIAKATRRGKGNIVLCSSDVASALQMAGVLDYAPALNSNNLQVDDTGATFAGVLNGRMRVYIDPYAGQSGSGVNNSSGHYMTVGYKGSSAFDAGLFYCPYVPLQMVRAVDPATFQPKIGFKTRYGVVANPFAGGNVAGLGAISKDSNVYYRRVLVTNIL